MNYTKLDNVRIEAKKRILDSLIDNLDLYMDENGVLWASVELTKILPENIVEI